MLPSLNHIILTVALQALREGNIHHCETMGFTYDEMNLLGCLSINDLITSVRPGGAGRHDAGYRKPFIVYCPLADRCLELHHALRKKEHGKENTTCQMKSIAIRRLMNGA